MVETARLHADRRWAKWTKVHEPFASFTMHDLAEFLCLSVGFKPPAFEPAGLKPVE
jgi:hypothetical protein